jgi:class 3 adenylate cyclase
MAEERKLVSVLFADIVGSTALGDENDPEVVRAVLGRYFDRAREIVELHGGTIENYIGDAVMAVFGVPRIHDDDAERAVRAALAIRDTMAPLNAELALRLEARIGVNSGEAVAALDARDQRIVTGDVLNVAARLQQHAEPGEVVVGGLTEQLTREAIEYQVAGPITVRGKAEPIAAFRALRARSDLPEQARGLPQMRARLVGRGRELTLLSDTFERVKSDRRGQLFTVVGNAGVGKSRLVGEFLARGGGGDQVRVLRGRCLPYGAGITYWPLIELVQADLEVTGDHSRGEVLAALDKRLQMVSRLSDRTAIASRLIVLLGLAEAAQALPDVAAERLPAELGWAFGEYVRTAAEQSAMIAVIDDLQWAEPAAIEMVGDVVAATADSALLLLCIARPELLEQHPEWAGGRANSTTIVLEPLNEGETRTLIGRLLDVDQMPEELRATIVGRSGGNPLFCEEFVRMLIDEGRIVREGDRWRGAKSDSFDVRVPESIQALLAARLDGLGADDKALAQAASVIGEQFDADQLSRLRDRDASAGLQTLVRGGFVLPDRASGARSYRFKHLLIRDAAYASLPKSERARLHEAIGLALDAEVGDRREEYIEILAHHAERTLTLSLELRQAGPQVEARAVRALSLSLETGRRSVERGNGQALDRFIATARAAQQAAGPGAVGLTADLELLEAQVELITGNLAVARQRLERAAELARSAVRQDVEADAQLAIAEVLVYAGDDADGPVIDAALASADQLYASVGNRRGRLRAQMFGLEKLFQSGRMGQMLDAGLALVDDALANGEKAVAAQAQARLIGPAIWTGRTSLAEELANRADALAAELGLLSTARMARFFRARLHWARGELSDAEADLRPLLLEYQAAGEKQYSIATARLLAETFVEVGRLDEAEQFIDLGIERSVGTGERWSRTELFAFKAWLAAQRGAADEAEALLAESHATLRDSDYAAGSVYHAILGQIRAVAGRYEEAETALRKSLGVVRTTDNWSWQMNALDLAEFLIDRGRFEEATLLVAEVAAAMAGTDLNIRRPQLERLQARLASMPATATG